MTPNDLYNGALPKLARVNLGRAGRFWMRSSLAAFEWYRLNCLGLGFYARSN